jgi:predicted transcriptional regulator
MADNLRELTASIVAAYVEANRIAGADLPSLIQSTYTALRDAGRTAPAKSEAFVKPTAAQIRKSITPDALISFIDGRHYRMLKRHLTTHGLTAKTYQERYGLPLNYPITAPSYSAARSALATKMGLGRKATLALAPLLHSTVAAKPVVKAARKSRAAEKAGPGARVPKAVRSTKTKNTGDDGLD